MVAIFLEVTIYYPSKFKAMCQVSNGKVVEAMKPVEAFIIVEAIFIFEERLFLTLEQRLLLFRSCQTKRKQTSCFRLFIAPE